MLCTIVFMENIPKQLCRYAMKLVVLFARRARWLVVWCGKCLGGGGGSPLWRLAGWQVTAASSALPHVSDVIWSCK